MATEIQEIISEKKKLEDDIFTLIAGFETRNKGTSVEEITITKASIGHCCGPELVSLKAKVNINATI